MQTANTHLTTPDAPGSLLRTTRIPVAELKLGMFISKLDRPWTETPFEIQGFELKDLADVETLCNYCEYVDIEERCASYPGRRARGLVTRTPYQKYGRSNATIARAPRPRLRRRFVPRSLSIRILMFSLLLMLPVQASAEGHPQVGGQFTYLASPELATFGALSDDCIFSLFREDQ